MINDKNMILLNVNYIRPSKKEGIEESFEVIYKDENNNVYKSNEPALVDIYFVKPEYRNYDRNKPQERIEKLNKKRVLYSKIREEIAKEIGEEGGSFIKKCWEEYQKPVYQRDPKFNLDRLYGWRFAYACDFQPEFYFMKQWYETHKSGNVKLTKAFFDIETDIIDYIPNLEKLNGTAYAPVNCVSVFLEEGKECYTFILKPYKPSNISYSDPEEYKIRYALYEDQLKQHISLMDHMDEFIQDLSNSFESTYGSIKYNLRSYDEEIELITDVFRLINNRKPNFCLIWNMRFDIQYLYERIKALGYDPKSIMCHPDFENPKCYFHIDKTFYSIEKQYDYFYCSSYTQYICQMRLYSSVRKSQQMLKSVSLNAIGERELRDKKVEYSEETDMMHFPYRNWKRFVKYNIKDSLLQVGIERKTNDVMTYYSKSHSNLTPYNKIFRETHLLRNVREMYFNRQGWVQGNNLNIIGTDPYEESKIQDDSDEDNESTFKGAIMADPEWNDKIGMPILGNKSNTVFQHVIDFDMGSFYPSNKIASNMDPSTLIFKAEFDNDEFISGKYNNRSLNTIYQEKDKNGKTRNVDNTGEAINTFASNNLLTFGYNYLGLPSITELYRMVNKELKNT
jgi:hypothetical protein